MELPPNLKYRGRVRDEDDTSSNGSPRSASPPSPDSVRSIPSAGLSKGKSLTERSRIPPSFAVTFGTILGLQYSSGLWADTTLEWWFSSVKESSIRLAAISHYPINLMAFGRHSNTTVWEYCQVAFVTAFSMFLFYVFFLAPALHGLWTGRKGRRAVLHRYMGLSYLIHYVLAGVELATNYEVTGKASLLTHIIAVTGVLQGTSAFFTFKVLPELMDPGYYSDKAVLSRNFVHENIFFTVMAVFGSIYYNPSTRANMRQGTIGCILEVVFVFWPYILVRPWYPITRFSNAGQTYKGRTSKNQKFYQIATSMVKFFYLWAKYFLAYFINFLVYMDKVDDAHWPMIQSMLWLNTGTVSLSVFLHTLRFKKILPAKFTMSVYLVQIYLTFLAVPMAVQMFSAHIRLCGLCLLGLALNMTRKRSVHAAWCALSMGLLMYYPDLNW